MIYISYPLFLTQAIVDKIWLKHHVAAEEVEEAIYDDEPACIKGVSDSYLVFGRTLSGRYLFVVLRRKGKRAHYKIITAREMHEKERRFYDKCQK